MARPVRENLRETILQAAEKRLWHYGYKKTTVDEIAGDAGVAKGTVYLYFESKEDIYCVIVAQIKAQTLARQEEIAVDSQLGCREKVRRFLKLPIETACGYYARSPQAHEMVTELRPHLMERLLPFIEREVSLLAQIIEEGNERSEFAVADPASAALSLKTMTLCLMPPHPYLMPGQTVDEAFDGIVDLAYEGLKRSEGLKGANGSRPGSGGADEGLTIAAIA